MGSSTTRLTGNAPSSTAGVTRSIATRGARMAAVTEVRPSSEDGTRTGARRLAPRRTIAPGARRPGSSCAG